MSNGQRRCGRVADNQDTHSGAVRDRIHSATTSNNSGSTDLGGNLNFLDQCLLAGDWAANKPGDKRMNQPIHPVSDGKLALDLMRLSDQDILYGFDKWAEQQ